MDNRSPRSNDFAEILTPGSVARESMDVHPCFDSEAHNYFARMHIAVAPKCNIQCNYCDRKWSCSNECGPGKARHLINPSKAVDLVEDAVAQMPHLSTIGVAGPGDSLASGERTFQAIERIQEIAPWLKFCIATNGLLVEKYMDRLKRYKLGHLSMTINAIDPVVGSEIYSWVVYDGRTYTGRSGAELLLERQLTGLHLLRAAGIKCKVNTVLIPGVNENHIDAISHEITNAGAVIHNIMPLINKPTFNTVYGRSGIQEPEHEKVMEIRAICEKRLPQMRHCHQCRADAVGFIHKAVVCGQYDSIDEQTAQKQLSKTVNTAKNYQVDVAEIRKYTAENSSFYSKRWKNMQLETEIMVAVATSGYGKINQHFGQATEFQIYRINRTGYEYLEFRQVNNYCLKGHSNDEVLPSTIASLVDCYATLVAKIGPKPLEMMRQSGLRVLDEYAGKHIGESLLDLFDGIVRRSQLQDSYCLGDHQREGEEIMKLVEIYEPAMCCSTGICGSEVNQTLVTFAELVDKYSKLGINIRRFNMAQSPEVFVQNEIVKKMVAENGANILPLTFVDNQLVAKGYYLTDQDMAAI